MKNTHFLTWYVHLLRIRSQTTINASMYQVPLHKSTKKIHIYFHKYKHDINDISNINLRRLWTQQRVSGVSNYIPQNTLRCNHFFMPEMSASSAKVLIWWDEYMKSGGCLCYWTNLVLLIFQATKRSTELFQYLIRRLLHREIMRL